MSEAAPRASRIEAVVFDLDGVLIDSESVWEASRRALAAETAVSYPEATTRAVMGMSAPEWARYLHDVVGIPLAPAEIDVAVVDRVAARYRERLPLEDGAVPAVRRMAARGPVAIASSSNRSLIELFVELAGLEGVFRAIVSAEEVARGKPSPDVYLRAAERLGVPAARCCAVEDSTNGLRAAHAAGMSVVATPNRDYPPSAESLSLARVVLPGVAALDESVIASVERTRRTTQE